MKVTVIDYGLSNLLSVRHAFAHFGAETLLTSDPADVLAAEKLVLPGVGAFKDGMDGLARLGLIEPIRQKAAAGTPLLGICLGMQMLFDEYAELYLGRDPRLLEHFSHDFSGYTGCGDFLVQDVSQWHEITRLDFSQVPEPIRWEMQDIAFQDLADTVIAVTAFFHIHLPVPDAILASETARLVLIFRQDILSACCGQKIPGSRQYLTAYKNCAEILLRIPVRSLRR